MYIVAFAQSIKGFTILSQFTPKTISTSKSSLVTVRFIFVQMPPVTIGTPDTRPRDSIFSPFPSSRNVSQGLHCNCALSTADGEIKLLEAPLSTKALNPLPKILIGIISKTPSSTFLTFFFSFSFSESHDLLTLEKATHCFS